MIEYPKIPNIFERDVKTKKLSEGVFSTAELEYLQNTQWAWTEKIDGTNIRVHWDGHSVSFAGRTDKANIPPHLLARLGEIFCGPDNEEIFEQVFGGKDVILFGEGYGEKIQKDGKEYGPVNFTLFDVYIGGYWLDRDHLAGIACSFGIKPVPMVGTGTLNEAVEFIKKKPISYRRETPMEGIVCTPVIELHNRQDERIIVKIKCRDF